jgi:hypothetical protein
MKILFALISMFLAGTIAIAADAPAGVHPDTSGPGWKALFEGDLQDAVLPNVKSKEKVWQIKDGALTASKDLEIWTKEQYEKFTIDLEFKFDAGANSGVLVYCTNPKDWIPNAIEIQILDDSSPKWAKAPANWRCGAIFGHVAPKKATVKKPGEWNRMTVVCNGRKIRVALNGEWVTEIDLSQFTSAKKNPDGTEIPAWLKNPLANMPTKGQIGLQGKHGPTGSIYFRNVKIKSLDETAGK